MLTTPPGAFVQVRVRASVPVMLVAPLVLRVPVPPSAPPLMLKAPAMARLPLPPRVPDDRVTLFALDAPSSVSTPPLVVSNPPKLAAPDTVTLPALTVSVFSLIRVPIVPTALLTVTVGFDAPRSMTTVCPAIGAPSVHLAALLQTSLELVFHSLIAPMPTPTMTFVRP